MDLESKLDSALGSELLGWAELGQEKLEKLELEEPGLERLGSWH